MSASSTKYLNGASRFVGASAADAPTIGELATWEPPLSSSTTGSDVDRLFRGDPTRRSVTVDAPAGPIVVNRTEFYLHFSGTLGYGRALMADKRIDATLASSVARYPSTMGAVDVAVEVATMTVSTVDDIAVIAPDGSIGTLGVSVLFQHLRERAEQREGQAQRSERRFRALVRHAADGVMVFGVEGALVYSSPAAVALLGVDGTASLMTEPASLIEAPDLARFADLRHSAARDRSRASSMEFEVRRDGALKILQITIRDRLDEPDIEGVVVNVADVSAERRLSERLEYQATHDPLTGLSNRSHFTSLGSALFESRRGVRPVAVLFCDLDGFKTVNDQFGHTVGDAVIVAVANRFARELPPGAVMARLGGDEFAVVVEGDASLAKAVADRLTRSLVEPITACGQLIVASASIGIATTAESGDFGVLLQRADDAMYAAKRDGRGIMAWRRTAHESSAVDRVAADLLPALGTGQVTLHFQPVVAITSRDVVGHEALLRWRHPELGDLPPADFVHIAESRRLMVPVGRWVIEEAIAACGRWKAAGNPTGTLNVNISTTQLLDPSLGEVLLGAVGRHGLEPCDVVLELTETAVMNDVHDSAAVLRGLRESGVRVAIDDFGIGYSSLSYLCELPVDVVKLDARFTRRLCTSPRDRQLIRGIISMVHSIGMIVVSEAVEFEEEHEVLAELGCDLGQGYLYGRPAPGFGGSPAASSVGSDRGVAASRPTADSRRSSDPR